MKKDRGLRRFLALCGAALLFCLLPLSAAAEVPERPANLYVLDSADVLTQAVEDEIISSNEKLFRETGAEIVIVTVDFLDGRAIDDYAYDLFNIWGVGSSERNNGLLLLMGIFDDDYYALPGYGLDEFLTGSKLDDLLYDNLEADFAGGDYSAGALKFFRAAKKELETYYGSFDDGIAPGSFSQGGYNYSQFETGFDDSDDLTDTSSGFSDLFKSGFSVAFSFFFRMIVTVVIVAVIILIIRSSAHRRPAAYYRSGNSGFWQGMFLGSALNRRRYYNNPPPPGGFGGPRPPQGPGGFGGFGGFGSSGRSGGFGGFSHGGSSRGGGVSRSSGGFSRSSGSRSSGGFSHGGGSRGGGAGRRR